MPHNILIADDVKMNRVLLIDVLNSKLKDANFIEAENGMEVMQLVEKEDIDLIILDLIMPILDGYAVLKELKSKPETMDIPVIVNSAISDIKSIEDTLRQGAIDYFTKPLTRQDMDIILPLKAKNALTLYEHKKTIEQLNQEIYSELKNATAFQNMMLPKSKSFSNLDIFMKYHPCLGIGGDYFDCVQKNNKVWFMIADVTGHGIAAGMASSMVKVLFRTNIDKPEMTPGGLLSTINHNIFEIFDFGNDFHYFAFTAFVGCVENNRFTYANAGQPYPIVFSHANRRVGVVKENGLLIGIKEDVTYEDHAIDFHSGDSVFLYTDGLFSSGKNSDFKNWVLVEDFANLYKDWAFNDGDAFLTKAYGHFKLFHMTDKGDYTDDVAMMLLNFK